MSTRPLIIFGGKGGVGKTTCACAVAVAAADRGSRTILVSTDPAHSVGDCLCQAVGPRKVQVNGVPGLDALEVDAEASMGRFRSRHDSQLKAILTTATYLDDDDATEFMRLDIPGLDEVMGLEIITDLMQAGEHETHVLDTAPTGHALRLLSMPDVVDGWIKMFARLRLKYHEVVSRLAGHAPDMGSEDFLFKMKRTIKQVKTLLRDREACEFVMITIPETMAIEETARLHAKLVEFGVHVRFLVVTHLVPEGHGDCAYCEERRREQTFHVAEIRRRFPRLGLIPLEREATELRGVERLRVLGARLEAGLSRHPAGNPAMSSSP